ncbi:hypothetical protein [Nocardia sp. NPDC049149]|uniref:hypothetical protein n=1 Tax=Nocardia sp. NPDC049149 TaxID=3364315 RepID=UPI00371F9F9E
MSLSRKPTQWRRRLTRVAVAGALLALPLGALAATASADTQDPTTAAVAPVDQDGSDISGHPHGPDWQPGQHRDGPRGPHHHRNGPWHGNGDRPQPGDAPQFQQFQRLLPPTGSG